jgi:beta-mannosidase
MPTKSGAAVSVQPIIMLGKMRRRAQAKFIRMSLAVWMAILLAELASPRSTHAANYVRGQNRFGPFSCIDVSGLANATVFPLNVGIEKTSGDMAPFVKPTNVRNGVPYSILGTGNGTIVLNSLPCRRVNWALSSYGTIATSDTCRSDATPDLAIDGSYHLEGLGFANGTQGQLTVTFPQARDIDTVTCISGNNPACTPIDYTITALENGQQNPTALQTAHGNRATFPNPSWDVSGLPKRERWGVEQTISFTQKSLKWVKIAVTDTLLGYVPNILEFEAWGTATAQTLPSSVSIPVGLAADEVYFLGNVGYGGYPEITQQVTVANYVLVYSDNTTETAPLVNGVNFASWQGVHLVPNAHPAFYFNYRDLPRAEIPQVLWYSYKPTHPEKTITSIRFEVVDARFSPILVAITVRKGGSPISINYTPEQRVVAPDVKTDAGCVCLDGNWKYFQDQGDVGESGGFSRENFNDSSWVQMPVPSNWYLQGLDYFGIVWFRKSINVPADFSGKTVRLRFDGVHYGAKVWLNGQYLGEHEGYATPFEFDVTGKARPGSSNVLAVKVDSPLDPGWPFFQYIVPGAESWQGPGGEEICRGGIWRPVYLVSSGTATIGDIYVTTDLNNSNTQATVNFKVTLNSRSTSTWAGILSLSFAGKNCSTPRYPLTQNVTLNSGKTVIEMQQVVANPKLWWTWDLGNPNLYLAQARIDSGGTTSDSKSLTFGIRKVEIDGYTWRNGYPTVPPVLKLNGEKVFLRGGSLEEEQMASLVNRQIRQTDLTLMKNANLNFVRMVAHVDISELYDLADEMGMLVYAEFTHGSFYARWSYEIWADKVLGKVFPEMVVMLRNHPSICAWNCINEDGQGEVYSRRTCEAVENTDATRPISVGGYFPKYESHLFMGRMDRMILLQKTPFAYLGSVDCGFNTEADYIPSAFVDTAYMQRYFGGTSLFPYDGLDYFWNNFQYYHCPCLVRHLPGGLPAVRQLSLDSLANAILRYGGARDDLMYKFHKLVFENIRLHKFNPSGAYTYYTMRSGVPLACQWNLINYDFTTKDQYQAIKEASRPILPALEFGLKDLSAIYVINDTFSEGSDYTLVYGIKAGSATILSGNVAFHLDRNSSQKVVTFSQATGLYTMGKDMVADIQVKDAGGAVIAENQYQSSALDFASLYLNLLPFPPTQPVNTCWFHAKDFTTSLGAQIASFAAGYGGEAVNFNAGSSATYRAQIPAYANYCIKIAGIGKPTVQLSVDGSLFGQALLGDVALSRDMPTTGTSWSGCSWFDLTSDGDHQKAIILRLTPGAHDFKFSFQNAFQMNAWCIQRVPDGYYWGDSYVSDTPRTYLGS